MEISVSRRSAFVRESVGGKPYHGLTYRQLMDKVSTENREQEEEEELLTEQTL